MASPRLIETVVVGPLEVNCYLYGDPDTGEAVCIDPGSEGERILERIAANGLSLQAVLITHSHADHIMAAHSVSGPAGVPVLAPDGEQELWDMAADFCAMWGFQVDQPPPPDRWIPAGRPLRLGSIGLDVLDVRGHSPAGLAYAAEGIVFPGDALFEGSIGRTDLPGQDHSTLIDRIRQNLLSLPANTVVCPGHGPQSTIGQEARWNPYLQER